jgi:hypothetical protein
MAKTTENKMTVEEKKEFDKQRAAYFKGSISVMVIYGTFILLLALIGIFSESGKEYIFKENFSFTVTFIGGTLIVITLLLIQLLTYKLPEKVGAVVDNNVCPDFWELKKTTPAMLSNINSSVRNLASYYCEAPANIGVGSTRGELVGIGTATTVDKDFTNMVNDFNLVNGAGDESINNVSTMTCGRIYPEYMAFKDIKAYPDVSNTLRCKFIEECSRPQGSGTGQRTFGGHTVQWNSVCRSV